MSTHMSKLMTLYILNMAVLYINCTSINMVKPNQRPRIALTVYSVQFSSVQFSHSVMSDSL